jgi:hypothetical protein
VQSLKTTAGAMLISAAFLAFRPMMPSASGMELRQPTQVAREDAADGGQPCPRTVSDAVESVAVVESDGVTAARCEDRRRDTAESTTVASAPLQIA